MSYINKLFFIIIFIVSSVYCQDKWYEFGIDPFYEYMAKDLSVDSLRNIILGNSPIVSDVTYNAAVYYLYYHHKDTEYDFLLENLNTEIDSTIPELYKYFTWSKVYTDAYILGLLGAPDGITKMRMIADNGPKNIKIKAMHRLADAGIYDYYDFIRNEYLNDENDQNIINILAIYARDERYLNEVRTILINKVYASNSYLEVLGRARDLGYIQGAY